MIKISDTLLLASTKLKVRKIRLGITIIICSLLFAILSFAATTISGVTNSFKSFGKEGYGGRFLVQALPITYPPFGNDPATIASMETQQRDLVAQKKATAKKLGLQYDEITDPNLPVMTMKYGGNVDKMLNSNSPIVTEYFRTRNNTIPGTSYDDFSRVAHQAGATATYKGTNPGFMGSGPIAGSVTVLLDGKESYAVKHGNDNPNGPRGIEALTSLGWNVRDSQLLLPFILPGQTLALGQDNSIPVIAPMSAAEEVLGLKALPQTATNNDKRNRLIEVRQKIAGKTALLCYRNTSAQTLLDNTIAQQNEIEQNKNKKDYTRPSLEYQLPTTPCGAVTIKRDVRTVDEKKEADNKKAFDTQFNGLTDPEQELATVRIVGVTPDLNYQPGISATAIFTSLFSSTLGNGWFSPSEAISKNPTAIKMTGSDPTQAAHDKSVYYAEFATVAQAKQFIDKQTCLEGTNGVVSYTESPDAAAKKCIEKGKVLNVMSYGNSAGAIEEFQHGIRKGLLIAVSVIVIVAAVIMMGTVGKIIADGRRETAVFRALGAKRFDIAQIYVTYTVILSLCIALVSITIGCIVAAVLDSRIRDGVSVQAVIAYNAQDPYKVFSVFGINPLYLVGILGAVITAGLLSTTLPLLTNMRRNPIRDMRDDS